MALFAISDTQLHRVENVYQVEADSEDHARELWEEHGADGPIVQVQENVLEFLDDEDTGEIEVDPCEQSLIDTTGRFNWLGLDIEVSRSQDGKLVVDISTAELPDEDTVGDSGVPRLRVYVNEANVSED